MRGIRIGQLLVEQGILSSSEVEHILSTQRRSGRPFGDLAERLFGINPRAVEDAWVRQYADLTQVQDLDLLTVDPATTRLLNRRQAWQFHVVPVGRDGEDLVLVTDQAHLIKAMNFASATFKEPFFVKTARTDELRNLLMKVYPVPGHMVDFARQLATV
jgi:hypothetical protein